MKIILNWALSRVLAFLAGANIDDLLKVVKLTAEAATKFTTNTDKRAWVLSELKVLWADKEESTLRFLLETALKYAKTLNTK